MGAPSNDADSALVCHLPGREDVGRVVVMFADWVAAFFRVEYHTNASLDASVESTGSLVESLVKVFPNQKSQFELLKMHLTAHMAPTIKARGTPKEYSSNLYEHKHKTMVKQPARNTNCRDVGCDIAFRQECLAAVKQIAREEAVDPQCETAMRLALFRNLRVLTCTSRRMVILSPHDDMWSAYCEHAGADAMEQFAAAMGQTGYLVPAVQVHTALAIPPHDHMDQGDNGQVVKAPEAGLVQPRLYRWAA
ncbi:hypothetical protein CLOM_g7308 [Closterium sp. NIES-68]|nr:hypothetical protein CLOM_g7308 [Closterium sp. NIES-68]GJP62597.1 hypothetical protein CLOP_g19641 [Closterium sp. NIES-67]